MLVIILGINAGLQEFAPMLISPVAARSTPPSRPASIYITAFTYGKFGYATAIGTVLMLLTLTFSFVILRARYQRATDVEI